MRHGAGEVRGPRPGRSRGRLHPSAGRPGQGRRRHLAPAGEAAWSWRSAASTGSPPKGRRPELRRCRSALRFERVNSCKCRNVDPAGKECGAQPAGGRVLRDRSARRGGDASSSPAAACCGSRSNAWRPSSPISGRPGRRRRRPTHARRTRPTPRGLTAACGTRVIEPVSPGVRSGGPAGTGPCRSASTAAPPDFAERFRAFLATKREAAADVEEAVRAIIAEVAAERRPRPDRAHQQVRPHRSRRKPASRSRAAEIEIGLCRLRPQGARCAHARARPHRGLSPPADAAATSASPTRSASSSARAGPRSRRSASTCPAAPRPIPPRC